MNLKKKYKYVQSYLPRNNSVKELSIFAESAAAVNRVVLQHMSINIWAQDTAGDMQCNVAGLSPPSESRMLQRRKSLQKGKSLQLNRFSSNSKVLSIQVRSNRSSRKNLNINDFQDLIGPVPIASPSC